MRPGILCLLFVSACSFLDLPDSPPVVYEYALTWTCESPEGCERTDELRRIDRATITDYRFVRFTSTYDETYEMESEIAFGPSLIDRATITDYRFVRFTSTYDETYEMESEIAFGPSLPPGCSWMYFLTFFGHELERAKNCEVPGGFELEISIPNEDPGRSSMWHVEGLDVLIL
jgi:hypothetical protein